MKIWAFAAAICGVGAALTGSQPPNRTVLYVTGNTQGYLSPCGCSDPMAGGITRRGSVVHGGLYVDTGRFVGGSGRQDRMKAQTYVQSLITSGIAAINFTPDLSLLGKGDALALTSLAGGKFVSCQIEDPGDFSISRQVSVDGISISGATAEPDTLQTLGIQGKPLDDAVAEWIESVSDKPLLLLDGDRLAAERLSAKFPSLSIVYNSAGDPPSALEGTDDAWRITPGARSRFVLRLVLSNQRVDSYQPLELGPEIANDPAVARVYAAYLKRVNDSNLLEQVPRLPGGSFAGTASCGSCHAKALAAWKLSGHSHALRTLIDRGHSRDPECVKCHVVGLENIHGFRSVADTPQLANVGCESCHGPGKAHAAAPYKVSLPTVREKQCVGCHTVDNSPRFDFKSYWAKIRH